MLLTPPGRPTDRPIVRPTVRPTDRCLRSLLLPLPTLSLLLGGLAAVGCLWVWAGVGMLPLLMLPLLPLLLLPLLPELLMLPLLPLALGLLPGGLCRSMPVGLVNWRACEAACSRGIVPIPLPPPRLAIRGSYCARSEAVYLCLSWTRSRPLPLLRPAPPRLSLPILVRVLLLLAMARRVAMARLAALMERPSGPTRLCLPLVAVLAAALATSPVVG